jgi:hypothetical protein
VRYVALRGVPWGLLIGVMLSGCLDGPCDDKAIAGLTVSVYDADTSAPAGRGARGWLELPSQPGVILENLRQFPSDPDAPEANLRLVGAWERPGIYTVIVQKEGFQQWSASRVVVHDEGCHVEGVRLHAFLVKSSSP